MRYNKDVWSLLRRNISKGQLCGYAAANIVGLTVVLVGILFYTDSQNTEDNGEDFFTKDYIVLSKHVDGVGFTPEFFSDEEIADIESQPWTKKVGRFTSSNFTVSGTVNMGGRGFSTYLFFESVPDEFFDIKPEGWDFDPEAEDPFVPIIINKDYLALYNFGFAIPQGLPQLSEKVISTVPITLHLYGENKRPVMYKASIVGFSSRLNTIAVPQSFMDWANEAFGPDPVEATGEAAGGDIDELADIDADSLGVPGTSRLIIEVDRMAANAMNEYAADHNIDISGTDEQAGNISTFLGVVSGVVATNGVVICALALFILILSIFLMLQKSRVTLRNLMLLGYGPQDICRYYWRVVIAANIVITVLSVAITFAVRPLWSESLRDIGLGDGSVAPTLVVLAAYLLVVTAIDIYVVRRHMQRIWQNRG